MRNSTFDALNRLSAVSYTDSTLNIAYLHDEANSVTSCTTSSPIGHLTRIVENTVTTAYCYDARGNITQKRQTQSSQTDVTQYGYTSANRTSSVTTPNNVVTQYTRDGLGRIVTMTVQPLNIAFSSPVTAVSNITYLPFGPVSSYTLGNGQTVTRSYDANYALTDAVSPAMALHFARDAMGNIAALGNTSGASPATEIYHYDPLYRLAGVNGPSDSPLQAFTYNKTGDRLSKSGGGLANGSYGYTTGTHLLASTGATARVNDANGNTTGDTVGVESFGFGYNGRNRLSVVQRDGATVGTYTYNAFGQRVLKVATLPASITQRYAYDESGHLIGEYGTTTRDYIWLDDLPVALADTQLVGGLSFHFVTKINYVHADELGTPRAVTDNTGSTIWSWPYQSNSFGEQAPTSAGGYTLNLRYPGQYYDVESGLVDNGFRTYESATGRYLQSDPIGLDGGLSTFAYVYSDPMNQLDPSGLASGRWHQVPGTNTWVRIDDPHVPGQQTHAHIETKGAGKLAINIDGTASHGSDLSKMTRSRKVIDFLIKKGFALKCLGGIGDALFIHDMIKNEEAENCAKGDPNACATYQWMGGQLPGPPMS